MTNMTRQDRPTTGIGGTREGRGIKGAKSVFGTRVDRRKRVERVLRARLRLSRHRDRRRNKDGRPHSSSGLRGEEATTCRLERPSGRAARAGSGSPRAALSCGGNRSTVSKGHRSRPKQVKILVHLLGAVVPEAADSCEGGAAEREPHASLRAARAAAEVPPRLVPERRERGAGSYRDAPRSAE